MCLPGRCAHAVTPDVETDVDAVTPLQVGPLEAAVAAVVALAGFEESDPRHAIGVIGVRLAKAFDETGSVSVGAEVRRILSHLTELPAGQPPGPVDEIRLEVARRRVEMVIRAARLAAASTDAEE